VIGTGREGGSGSDDVVYELARSPMSSPLEEAEGTVGVATEVPPPSKATASIIFLITQGQYKSFPSPSTPTYS